MDEATDAKGERAEAKAKDTESKLRDTFVQILFSLTTAEIARQLADLINQGLTLWNAAPSYAHLTVATTLVTTSWVGWKRSLAYGKSKDVERIFSAPFIVLLIDVGLVIAYFIIVKGAEIDRTSGISLATPSAANETFWIMVVFVGYCTWDLMVNVLIKDPPVTWATFCPEWGKEIKRRGWISLVCLFLSAIVWFWLSNVAGFWKVIFVDIALFSLLLLFRALKQGVQTLTIIFIIAFIVFSCLAPRV
jgi:hypothetical protein